MPALAREPVHQRCLPLAAPRGCWRSLPTECQKHRRARSAPSAIPYRFLCRRSRRQPHMPRSPAAATDNAPRLPAPAVWYFAVDFYPLFLVFSLSICYCYYLTTVSVCAHLHFRTVTPSPSVSLQAPQMPMPQQMLAWFGSSRQRFRAWLMATSRSLRPQVLCCTRAAPSSAALFRNAFLACAA